VAGSGVPGGVGRSDLIVEITDAILSVAPGWGEVKRFVGYLGERLPVGRLFDDVIYEASVSEYLRRIVSIGVKCCGLAVFVRAACDELTAMARSHPKLPVIQELAARLEAGAEDELRLLTDAERAALRAALLPVSGLSAGGLAVIVNSVPEVVPLAVEGADTIDALLDVLEMAATPRGEIPVLILFLAALAGRKPRVRDDVWAWIDRCAPRLGVGAEELAPLRHVTPDAGQPLRVRAALAVTEENQYSASRYQLSRWLRWDTGKISDKHDEGVLRSKDELPAGGEEMLATFHEILRSADAAVVEVEFFLPISVINLNVDMWRVGHGDYVPLVGHDFRVVTHSTDRMNDGMFHAAWKRRWAAMRQSHGSDSARWLRWADGVPPSGDLIPRLRNYDVLKKLLTDCAALCCLGLHESQSELDLQLRVAMQAGVPAVLWRRDGGDVTELRTLLSGLAASGRLTELPAEVTELRRAAAGEPDDHLGHHISLIWDDYDEQQGLIAGLQAPQDAQGTGDVHN